MQLKTLIHAQSAQTLQKTTQHSPMYQQTITRVVSALVSSAEVAQGLGICKSLELALL